MWWHGVHLDLPQGLLTSWQFRGSGYLWITFSTQPRSWAGGWGQHSLLVAGFAAFQDRAPWPWSGGSKHLPSVWSPRLFSFHTLLSPTAPVCRAGSRPFLGREDPPAVPIPSCGMWGLKIFVFWLISSSLPLQKNWFLIIQKEHMINGKLEVPAVLW